MDRALENPLLLPRIGSVTEDSEVLADGLRRLFALLDDGERALAIGHSPTSEAAVFALTGVMVEPLGKGEGVVVVLGDGDFTVTRSPWFCGYTQE